MGISRLHAAILALLFCGAAWGMDTAKPDAAAAPADPALEQGRAAIAKRDWAGAQGFLRDAVARNPQNADAHNLYAFALRSGANPPLDLVFRHYNEALRIDPKHRAAHEYLGEAYLMSGNVAKAKEHLAQLDRLCTFGCEEFTKLKAAVARAEQQGAKK